MLGRPGIGLRLTGDLELEFAGRAGGLDGANRFHRPGAVGHGTQP